MRAFLKHWAQFRRPELWLSFPMRKFEAGVSQRCCQGLRGWVLSLLCPALLLVELMLVCSLKKESGLVFLFLFLFKMELKSMSSHHWRRLFPLSLITSITGCRRIAKPFFISSLLLCVWELCSASLRHSDSVERSWSPRPLHEYLGILRNQSALCP